MKDRALRVKDKLWIHHNGRLHAIPAEARSARAGGSAAAADELVAPFPCKILKLHVQDGASVKQGDPVVVVEAMKMEYSYSSPKDGVIEKVEVKEGTVVAQGTHFVRWKA